MKVLVTGYNGQLGYDVIKRLRTSGVECRGTDIGDFDITDEAQTDAYIKEYNPGAVVHCAAFTAVDKAETQKDACRRVNTDGTRNIARACGEIGAKLVYISTDYVFDGKGTSPFEVTDRANPSNFYGLTKYEGETEAEKFCKKLFIIRTSWAFGLNGGNFVRTMLKLAKEHRQPSVVNDQVGSPTYTPDLAKIICMMLDTEKYGVYHCTNEGFCSWYEFACAIFRSAGIQISVKPVSTAEYNATAVRPLNSRLSKQSLTENGFPLLPTWQDALERYMAELENQPEKG